MRTSYVICVPSYQRAELCNTKTLYALYAAGISAQCVHVYVASKKEYEVYKTALTPEYYAKIHIGKKGLVQQREYIMQQYPKGTHIVFMDDDIETIDLTMTHIATSLHDFLEKAFDITIKNESTLWGVYPVFNPFYRKPRPEIYVGLTYIVGALYGIINNPDSRNLRLTLTRKDGQKEDVERTIRYYKQDGHVVRFDRVGFITKYYGKSGGLGTFQDRLEPMKQAVMRLQKRFPELGSMYVKKTGMSEFRFTRIKPVRTTKTYPYNII